MEVGLETISVGSMLIVLNDPRGEAEMTAQLSYTNTTRQLHPWDTDRHGDTTHLSWDTSPQPSRDAGAGCTRLSSGEKAAWVHARL